MKPSSLKFIYNSPHLNNELRVSAGNFLKKTKKIFKKQKKKEITQEI